MVQENTPQAAPGQGISRGSSSSSSSDKTAVAETANAQASSSPSPGEENNSSFGPLAWIWQVWTALKQVATEPGSEDTEQGEMTVDIPGKWAEDEGVRKMTRDNKDKGMVTPKPKRRFLRKPTRAESIEEMKRASEELGQKIRKKREEWRKSSCS